jgi:hypothetical protein
MITPGKNGWLFSVGDVPALRALMQRIMDDPSVLPAAESIKESVLSFGVEATAVRFREALLSVVRPHASRPAAPGSVFDSGWVTDDNAAPSGQ